MEMGNNDDGGGFGVGVLFDTSGMGIFGTFVLLLLLVGIGLYCSSQKHQEYQRFCTDVCAQYGDSPVIEGSQCYCRDKQGIYDPSTARGRGKE